MILVAAALGLFFATPAGGQQRELPYWATISVTEANMRVGPSRDYRIDWVYKRKGLPVKVLRMREGWRLVEDFEGTRGWIAGPLLSRDRGAIVVGEDITEMRAERSDSSQLKWKVEPGVVGKLGKCDAGWCAFAVGERDGFVREDRLWGPGEP